MMLHAFDDTGDECAIQYNFIETLSTGYFYIQSIININKYFINIVLELNMLSFYKLIEAFTAKLLQARAIQTYLTIIIMVKPI